MSIVLVDNEVDSLNLLSSRLSKLFPKYHIQTFTDPLLPVVMLLSNETQRETAPCEATECLINTASSKSIGEEREIDVVRISLGEMSLHSKGQVSFRI